MDRVPDEIFNDLMRDVSGMSKWPTIAASDLQGLSGPQLQISKSDFLGKEQRASGVLANRGMVHQNNGSTSLALRIDSPRSGIPIKSNEQTSNRQLLASGLDSKNDVIFLGYAHKAQSGNPTESSIQASISRPVPWRLDSKQDSSSIKHTGNPQLGFPSQNKGQISSLTENSNQVSSSRPPPWRLDSTLNAPSLTQANHLQLGFPVISKGQTPNMYSTAWSMNTTKGASSIKDTHIQQPCFPVVSKGQTSSMPLSSDSSNKGASSIQFTHIKRSVIPPGSMGQAPNIFPTTLSLNSSKGASSIKDTNVQQLGLSAVSKGQSSNGCSLSLSLAVAKKLSSVKQAHPPQLGSLVKSLGQASSSRTELKGKDHVQDTSSSGHADRRKSGSPAPKIAKAGIAHVMYETIMQEMVGSYEVTEESLAKMTILGIPEPDPTKPSRRKHRSVSRSRSRPRSSGRDAKSSHLSSYRRRSRSPFYRSSYRSDRLRRRSSSSSSSSSEDRRRRVRRNRSRSRDRGSRRDRSGSRSRHRSRSRHLSRSRHRSRNQSRSRKKYDSHDKKTKKNKEAAPPAKTPTIAMMGKTPVDPEVVKVIRSLLAYNFKSWRVKDYQVKKPEFWYLFDESSVEYQYYRLKLSELQKLKKSIKDVAVQADACQTSPGEFSNEEMRAVALAEELSELKESSVQGQILLRKETTIVGMQTGLEQELPANFVQPSQSQAIQEETMPCVEQSAHRPVPAVEAGTPKGFSVEAAQSKNHSSEKSKSAASGTPEESTSFHLQFSELDASTRETAENLARFLVEVGPEIEGGFDLGIVSENPEFWFLKEKESPAYKFYHMKLTAFCQSSGISCDSIDSSNVQTSATQESEPQTSKYEDPGPLSLKPSVHKLYESEIIEILDSEDSGSQKSDHHDSEPLAAESQDSEPEEPEPKVSERQESKPKGFEMNKPKESEPHYLKPQEHEKQHSELQDSRPNGSKPQKSQPGETELLVTCCSEDDHSDSEDLSPPKSHHKVELQPVVPLDGGLQSTRPKDLHEQPQEREHNRDLKGSPPLVVEPQSTRPEEPQYQPEVLQPQPHLCPDGLEPMTDDVSFRSPEETVIEPEESTASEDAAESASPTQSSPRQKRARPLAVAPIAPKELSAEEAAKGLEPMTDVISFQSPEETVIEPEESTASDDAAESVSPTQSSPCRKRSRPLTVAPVPSKRSSAEEETGLESMTAVIAFRSSEETVIEPEESTASEDAAETASPTQSSPHRKRGRSLVVAPVPSERLCAEEEETGLEPMTDVISFRSPEETVIELEESTASEDAAESASLTQSSPRRKRGRPLTVAPVPSERLSAEEETVAVTVSTVDEKSSSALGKKPSGRKVLRKKQLKQAVPVDIKPTEKESDIPEGSCEAEEEPAKEPVKVAVSPGKGKVSVKRRQSGRPVRK